MQLKLHIFLLLGNRLMPRDEPSRLLTTGPNIVLLNKKVPICRNDIDKKEIR
jgi:hypothetical protein